MKLVLSTRAGDGAVIARQIDTEASTGGANEGNRFGVG